MPTASPDMQSHRSERSLVRVLVATALTVAVGACLLAPLPRDANGALNLPAVALEQAGLYRLEVILLVFYGGLLLVTPAFAGLVRGRLPVEISARGAKFAEEADDSAEVNRTAIKRLEAIADDLTEDLIAVNLEIRQMKGRSMGDSTRPTVDSER
jgi:hypothetical protein